MGEDLTGDVAAVGRIEAVPRILDVVCRTTGMGFSAVARVTETKWVACAVRDEIAFGLKPGGELALNTTICDEIRRSGDLVVFDDADTDSTFACHSTPKLYGFKSYISVPIRLADGRFFGTLCAIDPRPARLNTVETVETFKLFAELIAHHLDAQDRVAAAEAALRTEREAAQVRDQFLATLAHELRNPLAPLYNGLAVLELGRSDADRGQAVGMMRRQLGQLGRLVDDLLDVSRVTAGKVTLRTERVPLRAVVEAAVEGTKPLFEGAGHTLTLDVPADSVVVEAEPTRLIQVLTNLLNNAAKYTPPGGRVTLSVARDGADAVVRVTDTGVGISADQLPRVFDLFMQVGASLDRSQGGLGLGLTLVQRLVELHGGTVSAASDGTGRGSTFTVRLPVSAEPVEPPPTPVTPAKSPVVARRIVVVDDNADGADSLALLLGMHGHDVRTAYTGVAGLAAAREYRPDVMFLDIGLPGLNGYEVAERLRADRGGDRLFLVAMTGWGNEDDRKRAREAGFDAHLTKPVEADRVAQLLADLPRNEK